MSENFDLFGNPVRAGHGKRGRPPFVATEKETNKVKLLLAMGWSIERIGNALNVSSKTVQRYFGPELKARDAMRDRLDARRFEIAMELANAGNVGALKELGKMIERNDLMRVERDMASRDKQDGDKGASQAPGKKVIDQERAMTADADLMAELEAEAGAYPRH